MKRNNDLGRGLTNYGIPISHVFFGDPSRGAGD